MIGSAIHRGTWIARVLGDERALAPALAFAASDIALEDAGWFEGVMLCGFARGR
jgi:hypothetical protein